MVEQLFKDTLKTHGLHITPERLELFNTLYSLKAPCSLNELITFTKSSLDRSTVYRNIELFEEINVVNRIYTGWKYKVELSDIFKKHHHHMTCTNCGNIVPFEESTSFQRELDKLQRDHGFKAESHSLELRGLCKNCC